ncbi:MAG: hypothetical protein F6K24_08565 [Okeania sp. SIO2D1]|nr:hypothetical protein [Okeania sp. SIO2D1]
MEHNVGFTLDFAALNSSSFRKLLNTKTKNYFKAQWLAKQQAISLAEEGLLDEQDEEQKADFLAQQQQREDAELQVNAARKLVGETYYLKTGNFTLPGLAQEVDLALRQIDTHVKLSKDAVWDPKLMGKLKK